ncbi:MAG: HD domain-containing protein [Bacteroidales bacterium]|jgi:uncharacterized protein|nr:HD domain-containing protein [Bacteroidales bacterium]
MLNPDFQKTISTLIPKLKTFYSNDFSGHDWYHTFRVWKMSEYIAVKENADVSLCCISALLHDVSDWKKDEDEGHQLIVSWLLECQIQTEIIQKVCEIISETSFKGAKVDDKATSLESKIVMDADRLDAIGAIGIARAFAFGGSRNNPIHIPDDELLMASSFEEYKSRTSPAISHFYEKLLLLKDRMNTETAKKIAINRHQILIDFLKAFHTEWDFKDLE